MTGVVMRAKFTSRVWHGTDLGPEPVEGPGKGPMTLNGWRFLRADRATSAAAEQGPKAICWSIGTASIPSLARSPSLRRGPSTVRPRRRASSRSRARRGMCWSWFPPAGLSSASIPPTGCSCDRVRESAGLVDRPVEQPMFRPNARREQMRVWYKRSHDCFGWRS